MGDADMTAYDAEHTLAMLDAGTFDLQLRRRPGNGCLRLAALRAPTASPMLSRGVIRRGDCVVTVWCPACGKRPVHGWPWDSVEPGARRPHARILTPDESSRSTTTCL